MNETLEIIAKRYSCRSFSDRAVDQSDLIKIADAGNRAPTGTNRRHYQIIVVTSKELLAELEAEGMRAIKELPDRAIYNRIQSRGGKLFYNAPCLIFIAVKQASPKGAELIDLGIVAENIVLAATSLGINSCHCGLVAFCFTGNKAEEFKKKLMFPEGYECGMGVLLGYAAGPGAPHTPNPDKITFIG